MFDVLIELAANQSYVSSTGWRILILLAYQPLDVPEIAQQLDRANNTIYSNMSWLKHLGLVEFCKKGNSPRVYSLIRS